MNGAYTCVGTDVANGDGDDGIGAPDNDLVLVLLIGGADDEATRRDSTSLSSTILTSRLLIMTGAES